VLVSHPVHQHAYETAVAAQNAGLLRCFVTGIYYTNRGLTGAILRKLPAELRLRAESDLLRRWHPELDTDRVYTIGRYHILATALRRLRERAEFHHSLDLEIWAHRRFDEAVARFLHRLRGVELVHVFEGSGLATLRSAKHLGIATVLDVPSTYEENLHLLGITAPRADLVRARAERELADVIFAPSDHAIECLAERGVSREKILKIPYGVDPVRFSPTVRSQHQAEPFRALFVGKIGLLKGVRYLLDAWRALDLRNAELVLVGQPDDDGRQILREFEGHYTWPGALPKYAVHEWFKKSDVLVLPSLAEGSALVTYEALASGLPVIATSTSGSVVRDGLDGFVVPPSDARALRDAIRYLYENPQARWKMGASGREHVATAYTWKHYRSRIAGAYTSILFQIPAGTDARVAAERAAP
jgi:alpha-maltose-1-phosphate synthase